MLYVCNGSSKYASNTASIISKVLSKVFFSFTRLYISVASIYIAHIIKSKYMFEPNLNIQTNATEKDR